MPLTALAGGAAALSMAGLPLTLGFVAKDGAYEALLHASDWFPWLLMLIVIVSIFLGLAGLLAGVSPFRGAAPAKEGHDPAWSLWMPPLVARRRRPGGGPRALRCSTALSSAATATAGVPIDVSLSLWHGLTPALLLSALTLVAVGLG